MVNLKRKIYSNLTPWQTVLVSRHSDRPQTMDYVDLIFEDFVELHGDRAIGDDRALRCGFARLGDFRVMLLGHQKGHTLQERTRVFLRLRPSRGLSQGAEEHASGRQVSLADHLSDRHARRFPGHRREERGQAQLIATNLLEMSRLETPIVCVVIGEGGSGGALGIGIGDRVSMLEHAYYSVISPEGCAGILWKVATETTKPLAAEALRMTGRRLETLRRHRRHYPRAARRRHRDHREMANTLKSYLLRYLRELRPVQQADLLEARYQKFRKMGFFLSGSDANGVAGAS